VQFYTATSPLGPFITKPLWNINRRAVSDVRKISQLDTNGLEVLTPGGTITLHAATNTPVINASNAPAIPAQETWVARIPTRDGPVFMWMADRWQSAPDGVKGHDFQFWVPLEFGPDGNLLPLKDVARWEMMLAR
jgi:hypothetical protein